MDDEFMDGVHQRSIKWLERKKREGGISIEQKERLEELKRGIQNQNSQHTNTQPNYTTQTPKKTTFMEDIKGVFLRTPEEQARRKNIDNTRKQAYYEGQLAGAKKYEYQRGVQEARTPKGNPFKDMFSNVLEGTRQEMGMMGGRRKKSNNGKKRKVKKYRQQPQTIYIVNNKPRQNTKKVKKRRQSQRGGSNYDINDYIF